MKVAMVLTLVATVILGICGVWAQDADPPAPPERLAASDHPWDHGNSIDLSWSLSPDDPALVSVYKIYHSVRQDGPYDIAGIVNAGTDRFTVERLERNQSYYFQVVAVGHDKSKSIPARTAQSTAPTRQPFDGSRFWLSIIVFIFCGSVIYYINRAKKGMKLKIRKIAGLEAVEEAVGRATEMGRSCLFIAGIQDMNDIQTIAGLTILSRVSKIAAEFDAKIEVPTTRSLVMTAAREIVQASYLSVGRPEAYNQDLIYYVTDEQFGYVAYIQGMMVREKPAACFYMGAFFAESLILAETGNTIGAIQVAGTAMPAQLPFFVAACDYTLIGEEFFAASAYLSGEPEQLGSLKGQDVGKALVIIGIIFGVLTSTTAVIVGVDTALGGWLLNLAGYLREVILM
jgi:hypothetical protein